MANKNITVDHAKLVFLKDDPSQFCEKSECYSLEKEFEKTNNNRNFLFYLSIFAFVFLIGAAAIYWVNTIQKNNMRMAINLSDFEELNLQDILAASKKDYNDIIKLKQDIIDLQQNFKIALNNADRNDLYKKSLIDAKVLSPEDAKIQKDLIDKETEELKNRLRAQFENDIAHKQNQISAIEIDLKNFDKKKLILAQQNEQIIDAPGTLNDLNKSMRQKDYETKINEAHALYNKNLDDLRNFYTGIISQLTLKYNLQLTDVQKKYNQELTDTQIKYEQLLSEYHSKYFQGYLDNNILQEEQEGRFKLNYQEKQGPIDEYINSGKPRYIIN